MANKENSGHGSVLGRMQDMVAAWEQIPDRRCVFLRCYAAMTTGMLAAITTNRFADPPWVATLLERFAAYYFDALEAYDGGRDGVPGAWRWAHDLARAHTTTIFEDLLLGINAHINHDLALALYDTVAAGWRNLDETGRELRHRDFTLINTIIGETTELARQDVVERYDHFLRRVDHALPAMVVHAGEWEFQHVIIAWRDEVWWNAMALLAAESAEERAELRRQIEEGAVHRVRVIISELEMREHLLAMPIEELRRLHPHLPVAKWRLNRRIAIGGQASSGQGEVGEGVNPPTSVFGATTRGSC